MHVRTFVLFVSLLFVPLSSRADPVRLNEGFFFRYGAGFGFAASTTTNDLAPMTASGAAFEWELALGTAFSPVFALHMSLFGWIVSSPTIVLGNNYVWEVPETRLSQLVLGPGGSLYFGGTGILLSASVGPTWFRLTNSSTDFVPHYSVLGWGGQVLAGKEFQPLKAARFGLGVSFTFHHAPTLDDQPGYFGYGIGLRLTGTFN